jgi:hypothetical protein
MVPVKTIGTTCLNYARRYVTYMEWKTVPIGNKKPKSIKNFIKDIQSIGVAVKFV